VWLLSKNPTARGEAELPKIGPWAASFVLRVEAPRFNDNSMLVNPLADRRNEGRTVIKMPVRWRK
jgi:hypothetical protein